MPSSLNIFICISGLYLGLVLTSPVHRENNNISDKNVAPPYKPEIFKVSDVINNHIQKSPKDSDEDAESDCSTSCEESDTQDRTSSLQQNSQQFPVGYLQPRIVTSVPAYQGGYPNTRAYAFGGYQRIQNPYVYPDYLYGEYRVSAWPPVLSTYIHGLVPQEEMQRSRYDLDVLNPQNSAYMPGVVRPPRMLRDSDEDLLNELQHDAIMNNIIPTMSVPFARYAAPAVPVPAVPSGVYGPGGVSAVFPGALPGRCAQPLLFSCTPKVIRGTLHPLAPVPASLGYNNAPDYRHDSSNDNKSTIANVNSPTKVKLAPKSSDDKH